MKRRITILLLLAVFCATAKAEDAPKQLILAPGDNLQEACDKIADGGEVILKPGVYDLDKFVRIKKSLTLRSESGNPADTLVKSIASDTLSINGPKVNIENLSFENNYVGEKQMATTCIVAPIGETTIKNCVICGNSGACVSTWTMKTCEWRQNTKLTMIDCKLYGEPGMEGLEVRSNGHATLENCEIYNLKQRAIYVRKGNVIVRNSKIHDTFGVNICYSSCATFEDCEFYNNRSQIIVETASEVNCSKCEFRKNGVVTFKSDGTGKLQECRFLETNIGLCFLGFSSAMVLDCEISNPQGVGIYIGGEATPFVKRCKIHNAIDAGIFMREKGAGIFEECDIHDNAFPGIVSFDEARPTAKKCKIYNSKGNGVLLRGKTQGTLEECEIYGNPDGNLGLLDESVTTVKECKLYDSKEFGVSVLHDAVATIEECDIYKNGVGVILDGNVKAEVKACKIHDGTIAGVCVRKANVGDFIGTTVTDNKENWLVDKNATIKNLDDEAKE